MKARLGRVRSAIPGARRAISQKTVDALQQGAMHRLYRTWRPHAIDMNVNPDNFRIL